MVKLPSCFLSAPTEFVCGVLDGYMSACARVSKAGFIVSPSSVMLGDGLMLLLHRVGVRTIRGKKNLTVSQGEALRFHAHVPLTHPAKRALLTQTKLLQGTASPAQEIANAATAHVFNGVLLDRVTRIEDVQSSHPYVYDLTVETTLNMVQSSGIGLRDTFHSAGRGCRTTNGGVSYFCEVINVTPSPKSPTAQIHLVPALASSQEAADRVAEDLKAMMLSDVLLSHEVLHDPWETAEQGRDAALVRLARQVWPEKDASIMSSHVARFVLDVQACLRRNISVRDVSRAIRKHIGADRCSIEASVPEKNVVPEQAGPDGRFVIRVRLADITSRCAIANVEDLEERTQLERIAMDHLAIGLAHDVRVSGSRNISETYVASVRSYDVATGSSTSQYCVETDGTQLDKMLANGTMIDTQRTASNHLTETMRTLGVEALQHLIYQETSQVLQSSGDYMSPRHCMLLAAFMTFSGQALAVTRNGMANADMNVLQRASFEQTIETLVGAGVHGVVNDCSDVSAAVILGQVAPIGTGRIDVIIDKEEHEKMVREKSRKRELAFVGLNSISAPPKKSRREAAALARRQKHNLDHIKRCWLFLQHPERVIRVMNMQRQAHVRPAFEPPPLTVTEQDMRQIPGFEAFAQGAKAPESESSIASPESTYGDDDFSSMSDLELDEMSVASDDEDDEPHVSEHKRGRRKRDRSSSPRAKVHDPKRRRETAGDDGSWVFRWLCVEQRREWTFRWLVPTKCA